MATPPHVPPGAQILTKPPAIQLATQNVPPPTGLLVKVDDQLVINLWNSASITVRVQIRLLLPDGTIISNEWDITPPTNRTLSQSFFSLAEGFVLSAVAWIYNTGILRGQTYCSLLLVRGGITQNFVGQVLAQNYITTNGYVAFPGGLFGYGLEGRGNLRTITPSSPGFGSNFSVFVPSNATWRIMGLSVSFLTSATVSNRQMTLQMQDNVGNIFYAWTSAYLQPASTANVYVANNLALLSAQTAGLITIPIPPDVYLLPGGAIFSAVAGIQAADSLFSIKVYVEEWITP